MSFYLYDDPRRIAKRLKKIVVEEFGGEPRLNWFQRAVADALGFAHMHDMQTRLPCEAVWNGAACAEYLAVNGYLSLGDAKQAVEWLEEEYDPVVRGRVPRPGQVSELA